MAEPARRPVPGAWLRAVARKMKAWAESVLSEEESDFAAALAQARVPTQRSSPPSTDGARATSTPVTVTAPPVGLGPPEHWLRDVQGRRPQGPPADWVARVRKVAPHLVEGLAEQDAQLPVSEAHLSFRTRMLLASATDQDKSTAHRPAPVRDASRPAVLPEPSFHRASPRAPLEPGAPVSMRREVSGPAPVSAPREEPSRASKVKPPAPAHPFASPPATPVPLAPGRLSGEGPVTPVPSMMGGQPFANPVMVAPTPASPSEVCVPPLGEGDRERSLCASGFPQGISASQALELQREGSSAVPSPPPRASPSSKGESWRVRRGQDEAQVREAEAVRREVSREPTPPYAPRTWTEAEEEPSTSRFATPVGEEPRGASEDVAPSEHASWPELPSALTPESPDVAEELRLWTRLRRLEREQRGD
ncbi:hypothetical protein [Myxococcus qinghaiensis]|uniref:hypothetical protein n=1 Tax=Myxococcus qinghaiensis TaxID=2906758 RepID=UPI0020A6E25D|nr:hypothetical protein [Myxococcus qinghaiensis]MCP3166954.1 hypothetical protein [Myxococcus qinghaiensis]